MQMQGYLGDCLEAHYHGLLGVLPLSSILESYRTLVELAMLVEAKLPIQGGSQHHFPHPQLCSHCHYLHDLH